MAKSSNQKIKILYLMKILLDRTDEEHGLTLEEISNALLEYDINAERKTLYDDFEVLRIFGIDIEKRKGKSEKRSKTLSFCKEILYNNGVGL